MLCERSLRYFHFNRLVSPSPLSMMKAAATCTWLGDLVTALMVTDMMLQDRLYPHWGTGFRRWEHLQLRYLTSHLVTLLSNITSSLLVVNGL